MRAIEFKTRARNVIPCSRRTRPRGLCVRVGPEPTGTTSETETSPVCATFSFKKTAALPRQQTTIRPLLPWQGTLRKHHLPNVPPTGVDGRTLNTTTPSFDPGTTGQTPIEALRTPQPRSAT